MEPWMHMYIHLYNMNKYNYIPDPNVAKKMKKTLTKIFCVGTFDTLLEEGHFGL